MSSPFGSFDTANWIAFGTGIAGVVLGLVNLGLAGYRERRKNLREEFHRRVAIPIEQALEAFEAVMEDTAALSTTRRNKVGIRRLISAAQKAQARLSLKLRRAAESSLCSPRGWDNLGEQQYDDFVHALADLAEGPSDAKRREAVRALELQDSVVRLRIAEELKVYTSSLIAKTLAKLRPIDAVFGFTLAVTSASEVAGLFKTLPREDLVELWVGLGFVWIVMLTYTARGRRG